MSAPNLVRPRDIKGRITPVSLGTSLSPVLVNLVESGQVYRVNCIRAANRGTAEREVAVSLFRGGSHSYLYPPGAKVRGLSAVVIAVRDELTYLEEGDALYAQADVAGQVDLLLNWEEIS
jgi:hypothetical protein